MPSFNSESRPPLSRTIGIIGHKGKMGTMLSRELSHAGYVVHGLDRREDATDSVPFADEDMTSFFDRSRYIICCVPVTALLDVVTAIRPYLETQCHVLMDITSVKALPMEWMERAFSGPVIGSHPLFGPVPNPADKKVALVKGTKATEEQCAFVEALFIRLGCRTFWTTALEHDTGVAFAQSLNFTVSAAFFCALARHEGIRPFLTPSFKRHLEAARKHLTQDTAMFLEFTSMNPSFATALDTYRNILGEAAAGNLGQVAAEAAGWYKADSVEEGPSLPKDGRFSPPASSGCDNAVDNNILDAQEEVL